MDTYLPTQDDSVQRVPGGKLLWKFQTLSLSSHSPNDPSRVCGVTVWGAWSPISLSCAPDSLAWNHPCRLRELPTFVLWGVAFFGFLADAFPTLFTSRYQTIPPDQSTHDTYLYAVCDKRIVGHAGRVHTAEMGYLSLGTLYRCRQLDRNTRSHHARENCGIKVARDARDAVSPCARHVASTTDMS
jgi:hypothetical protein